MKPVWGWSLRLSYPLIRKIVLGLQIDLTDWALPLVISGPSKSDPENILGWGIRVQVGPVVFVVARISRKNWKNLQSVSFIKRAVDHRVGQVRAKRKRVRRGTAK